MQGSGFWGACDGDGIKVMPVIPQRGCKRLLIPKLEMPAFKVFKVLFWLEPQSRRTTRSKNIRHFEIVHNSLYGRCFVSEAGTPELLMAGATKNTSKLAQRVHIHYLWN